MPRISAGRFSLRLAPLRRFPIPVAQAGAVKPARSRLTELVREWLDVPADRRSMSNLPHGIEAEMERLYGI